MAKAVDIGCCPKIISQWSFDCGFGKRQSGCHGSLTAGTQDCGDSAGRAIADALVRVLRSGAQYVERRCVGQASQSIGAGVADKNGLLFIGEEQRQVPTNASVTDLFQRLRSRRAEVRIFGTQQ
ncbi:MAG TPA: hypothetical protein VN754_09670 [Candidatus Binataceae bacterium]|nr:hypothetical protein [Candidatus Binataceae bacterium]